MTTAAEQLRRLLHLVPQIADGEPHPISEVLAQAEVDLRTMLRDLHALGERTADPGGFVEGVRITVGPEVVEMVSGLFLRPMRVTAAELSALELGLAMLRGERPVEEQAAIDRARARLRDVIVRLPAGDDDQQTAILHGATGGAAPAVLTTVRTALRTRRKLALTYRRGGDAALSARTICPYSLVFAAGAWYLVAHCETSDGLRIFRLDRVETLHALAEGYRVPAGFAVEPLLRDDRLFASDRPRTMTVRYSPRIARWIAERHVGITGEDGTLVVEHPLADVSWGVRHVLQYGPDAEVLAPDDVRAAVRDRLSALVEPID